MYREQDNLSLGFVCLHRSIRSNWIWKDADKLKWWLDILMEVNHQPAKVLIKGTLFDCGRGESLNSLQTWALRWRTNVSAVRRFLELLEKDEMIRQKSEGKTTRLTVCNYERYNGQRHDSDTQTKRKRHGGDTPTAANNNANNENKVEAAPVLDILYTDEQKTGFANFQKWMTTNAPSVLKMKETFTIDQYLLLKQKYTWQKIADILEQMEGWEKLLTRRTHAYKTFIAFNKRAEQPQKAA